VRIQCVAMCVCVAISEGGKEFFWVFWEAGVGTDSDSDLMPDGIILYQLHA